MGRIQQVLPGIGIHRDAQPGQRLCIYREIGPGRQQDAQSSYRTGRSALPSLHHLPLLYQVKDAPCHPGCLGLGRILRLETDLHAAGILSRCAADQALPSP